MSADWDNPAEMLARAHIARMQGDRDLAYQMYARASELNPQDADAWQGRADTAASSDEALVSYGYASALDTNNQPLARTLDAAVAKRIEDATKGDVPLLVALGQEFAEVGLTDRARPLLERAAELDMSSTDAFVWLAAVAPDDQKQLDYLNRALATNPRDPRARAGLLAVKLPAPASVPPTPSRSERLAALSAAAHAGSPSAASETSVPTPSEAATMERLRKLRANVPPADATRAPASSPADSFRNMKPSGDTRLRNILIGLFVLVLLLAIAGFVLMQMQ